MTGALGFKGIQDHDKGSSVSGQVGLSYTSDYDKNGDDQQVNGPGA